MKNLKNKKNMTIDELKNKAASESWNKQGIKNQEQKIAYELGFLNGFDYAIDILRNKVI